MPLANFTIPVFNFCAKRVLLGSAGWRGPRAIGPGPRPCWPRRVIPPLPGPPLFVARQRPTGARTQQSIARPWIGKNARRPPSGNRAPPAGYCAHPALGFFPGQGGRVPAPIRSIFHLGIGVWRVKRPFAAAPSPEYCVRAGRRPICPFGAASTVICPSRGPITAKGTDRGETPSVLWHRGLCHRAQSPPMGLASASQDLEGDWGPWRGLRPAMGEKKTPRPRPAGAF